ncbi:MFS transporter [Salinibacterium xinjiangense]|uniref:Na+/melibiose symporter n=1 Tax=Salinibacterium xinjiangense TaxID=386302 RepID=A0A2C8YQU0_9MICO|nr:MFS transporter [Salinibacterium xinjiangense]GGK98225.1 MFS transporter [Salinibacterium xinjiangense]SOE52821.1 Na+/melibiose symporter [Salinibacterium xinjiangense]
MYISLTNRPGGSEGTPKGPKAANRVSSVVISLGVVSMLTDISSESVAAILPLYVTGVLGLSTVAYGILDGLYQGVSAIVRIGGGWVADLGDQPKWVAFFGYGLSAIARIGLLFASGFGALTAVLTADRLGKGIRTAPRDSLITAASQPQNLAASFGMHRALDNTGAAIGPLLAFIILSIIPNGFSTVFMVSVTFALVGVAVLGIIVPNRRSNTRARSTEDITETEDIAETTVEPRAARRRNRWRELNNPGLKRLLIVAGILGLLTIGDGFIYLVLQSRSSFAAQFFPLLYVGTNVAFLAFAVPIGRLADRFGRARTFVLGHGLLLAAYVSATLPITGAAITIVCLILLGAYYAATDGILSVLATQFTTSETRATAIAAAQTVVAIARFISAAGFGILWFAIGREWSMTVVSIGIAIAIPIVAVILRGARRYRADV